MTAPSPTRQLVTLPTPEQVPLTFELAPIGARLAAVLIDLLIIAAALVVTGLLSWLLLEAVGLSEAGFVGAIATLAAFLLFNGYFIASELRWQGRTPGKRATGLRVVARDGGPLSAGLVFARNLTRDLELYLPIQLLLTGQWMVDAGGPMVRLLTMTWVVLLALLPLANRHRARLGDLLAGTLVVVSPTASLLADLTEGQSTGDGARYHFSRAQLDVYGIKELQVLEDILRRDPDQLDRELLRLVCEKVKTKIDWPQAAWEVDPEPFLREFYAAQRARLESELLFGRRRDSKLS